MARCHYCEATIIYGGVKANGLRFCSDKCHRMGFVGPAVDQIPADVLSRHIAEVHRGACPRCGGPGPIDVHTSYLVWSALVVTSWHSKPQVCCRACGVKAKLGGACVSGVAGWWGFPWGIIITPILVLRNVFGLFSSPDPTTPSVRLQNAVKAEVAARLVQAARQQQATA